MYTREEFEELRIGKAEEMADDEKLQRRARELLADGYQHGWIHQTNWFGEPILNLPSDMFALQEILYETQPDYIVEVGTAWSGSLLFYSTIMEALGGEEIIGIDVYIPDDLKERIGSFETLSERIHWINASSTEQETLDEVQERVGESRDVMVILDSDHTHDHVLQELEMYAPLVGEGNYLVCCDTWIEDSPAEVHQDRDWGPGNSPATALDDFLEGNDDFKPDPRIDNKLLFSCNPGGYLKRTES